MSRSTEPLVLATLPSPSSRLAVLALVALLGPLAAACSAPAGSEEADQEAVAPAADAAAEDGSAVEYQPAFPEEVSADPLSASDVEQQEGAEGDHEHGADTHTHDGESDHEHGDGDHTH